MANQQLPLSNGVRLYVVDEGSGTPVVFVHGVMMSGRFFARQVPYFSPSFRVIVPDLRGHGQSEKVLHGHSVANYAHDLQALFDSLQIERPLGDGGDGRVRVLETVWSS